MERKPVMDMDFYKERTLYYKHLRDNTDNPTLYVEYEREMKHHFEQFRYLFLQDYWKNSPLGKH